MATRAVNSGDFIRPYRGNTRLGPQRFPEGATQTFKLGAPLIYSAVSGHENEVIPFVEDSITGLLGFAGNAASGTQGTPVSMWTVDSDAEYQGVVEDGKALAYTMLTGGPFSLVYDSTNTIWRVDTSDTGHDILQITQLIDKVGTVNGRVAFVIIPSARLPYQG